MVLRRRKVEPESYLANLRLRRNFSTANPLTRIWHAGSNLVDCVSNSSGFVWKLGDLNPLSATFENGRALGSEFLVLASSEILHQLE